MKTTLLKLVAYTVAAFALAGQSGMAQSADQESHRIVGTWMFRIQLQDCATGSAINAPFLSLLTFGQGGTVVETTSNGSFYPAVRSAGHGIWVNEEHGATRASTTAFITMNGTLARIQTIEQSIELDGPDALHTTSATIRFVSPTGVLLGTGCAAATASRLRFE